MASLASCPRVGSVLHGLWVSPCHKPIGKALLNPLLESRSPELATAFRPTVLIGGGSL